MPRPKGSKNRKKMIAGTTLDQIVAAKAEAAQEVESIAAEIDAAAAELKEKKAMLKAAKKRLAALEADEAAAREVESAQQRKAEAERIADVILKSGKTADEVMAALGVQPQE